MNSKIDYAVSAAALFIIIITIFATKLLEYARLEKDVSKKLRYYMYYCSTLALMLVFIFALLIVKGVLNVQLV